MPTEEQSSYVASGEFSRDATYIPDRVQDSPDAMWPLEAGRYRLIAARACPWAHRTIIIRRLLGLEDALSLGLAGPTHDWRSWTFDLDPGGVDPVLGIPRLRDAFLARFPDYERGITVPSIVDVPSGQIVTNDFDQMTRDFSTVWRPFHRDGAPELWPADLVEDMEPVMKRIYTEVNNGVYRCGFAGSQEAYEAAYERLFTALDWLEDHLADQRYLLGDRLTEADIRLFTTLVRFDPVYYAHFKANRQMLATFPHLWAYARDLFQTPGFGDTTDFVQIKEHYFLVHTDINPTGVVPAGPRLDRWLEPHDRQRLGGEPFAGATAPGPVSPAEQVPPGHGALGPPRS